MPLHAQDSDRLEAALRMAAARTEIAGGSLARVLRFVGIDMGGSSCWSWLWMLIVIMCAGFNVMGFLTFQFGRDITISEAAFQIISYDFIWLATGLMYFVYRGVLQTLARQELAAILFRYRQAYTDEDEDEEAPAGPPQLPHALTSVTNVDRDGFVERPADAVSTYDACCCSRGKRRGGASRGARRGSVSPHGGPCDSFQDQQADALLDSLSLRALASFPAQLAELKRALAELPDKDRPVGPLRTLRLRFAQSVVVLVGIFAAFTGLEVLSIASSSVVFEEASAIVGAPSWLLRLLTIVCFCGSLVGPVSALAGAVCFLVILSEEPYRIRAMFLAMARVAAVVRRGGGGAGLRRLPSGASVQAFLDEELTPEVPSRQEGSGTLRARVMGARARAGGAGGAPLTGPSHGDDDDGVSLAESGRDDTGARRRARFEAAPDVQVRRASVAGGATGRAPHPGPGADGKAAADLARGRSAPSMPLQKAAPYDSVVAAVRVAELREEGGDVDSLLRAARAGRVDKRAVAADPSSAAARPADDSPGAVARAAPDGWQDIHAAAAPDGLADAAPSLRPWIRLFDAQLARVRAQRRTAERVSETMGSASAAVTGLMLISGLLFVVLSQSGGQSIPSGVALGYGACFFLLSQVPLIKFATLTASLRRPLLTVTSAPAGVLAQCAAVRASELSVLLTARDHADAVSMLGSPIDPGSAIRIASLQVSFILLALQQTGSLTSELGKLAGT